MMAWNESDEAQDALNTLLGRVHGGDVRLPQNCTVCLATASVHAYFHEHRRERGGVWLWCSSCGAALHGTSVIPAWWRNSPSVESPRLTARPDLLDAVAAELDRHWNELLDRRPR